MAREKLQLTTVEKRAAHNLRRLREAKNFTTRSLSDATAELPDTTRISATAISHIENSRRKMSLTDSWVLARALGVSPVEFYLPIDEQDGSELTNSRPPGAENWEKVIYQLFTPLDESVPANQREAAIDGAREEVSVISINGRSYQLKTSIRGAVAQPLDETETNGDN